MISSIVILLLFGLLLCYLMFLWQVRKGLNNTVGPSGSGSPFVSIVVAVRNEQDNISRCLESLKEQTYAAGNYEIVVVDDHSTDDTARVIEKIRTSNKQPALSLYSLSSNSINGFGKPAAIALGVEQAKGEIILCTDADCAVEPGWVKSMVGCFQSEVAFVAGPVRELPSDSVISELQRLEFLGLITTAAGLIGSGKPIICNGANIAYRREAFARVSGFGTAATSCDDETLMQRMIQRQAGRVVFNSDMAALVETRTASTVFDFLNQRTRWASKRDHYENKLILVRLLCLFAFFLGLFATGIGALVDSTLAIPFLIVLLIKLIAEMVVLRAGARLFTQRVRLSHFLIAELFHVPYIVFAALIGQFSSFRWKDRNLEQ